MMITTNMDENDLYINLLDDIYDKIEKSNIKKTNTIIQKPQIRFDITKKTYWSNFKNIINDLNIDELHIINFFNKELSINSSINQDGIMLLKGKISVETIENTIAKYINIYKKCAICNSLNTQLTKINNFNYLLCLNSNCNSKKVINY